MEDQLKEVREKKYVQEPVIKSDLRISPAPPVPPRSESRSTKNGAKPFGGPHPSRIAVSVSLPRWNGWEWSKKFL